MLMMTTGVTIGIIYKSTLGRRGRLDPNLDVSFTRVLRCLTKTISFFTTQTRFDEDVVAQLRFTGCRRCPVCQKKRIHHMGFSKGWWPTPRRQVLWFCPTCEHCKTWKVYAYLRASIVSRSQREVEDTCLASQRLSRLSRVQPQ